MSEENEKSACHAKGRQSQVTFLCTATNFEIACLPAGRLLPITIGIAMTLQRNF